MSKKKFVYSDAVARLKVIVSEIEEGGLDVDVLSEKVREATELVRLCKETLKKVDVDVKRVLEELA